MMELLFRAVEAFDRKDLSRQGEGPQRKHSDKWYEHDRKCLHVCMYAWMNGFLGMENNKPQGSEKASCLMCRYPVWEFKSFVFKISSFKKEFCCVTWLLPNYKKASSLSSRVSQNTKQRWEVGPLETRDTIQSWGTCLGPCHTAIHFSFLAAVVNCCCLILHSL